MKAVAGYVPVVVGVSAPGTHLAAGFAAMAREQVTLHGWVYAFEKGKVFAYDQAKEQFAPIGV